MNYERLNIGLLKELHQHLLSFPFDKQDEFTLSTLDLQGIHSAYHLFADIDNDEVANGICWSASTLINLLEKKPVRALDEVISFVESVLAKHNEEMISKKNTDYQEVQEKMLRYEKALKEIAELKTTKQQLVDAQYIALLALKLV